MLEVVKKKERKRGWTREEVAGKIVECERAATRCVSRHQVAEELNIPRSTLEYWFKRREKIDAAPEVIAFFESPTGVAFLHRLVIAAQFVMTLVGSCGIRLVCLFLELAGLDRFVASSYGAQQKVCVKMEEAVISFGKEEKHRLAEGMKPKKITVCEDETFHPQICLVAIEPASNFILLEKYASNRKAEEWTSSLGEAMEAMPVEVIQSTSDEGKGICQHAKKDLGAHHSSDVFHVQQELVRGTSRVLESQKRQAQTTLQEAANEVVHHREEQEAYLLKKRGRGRAPDFDKRIEQAQQRESKAREDLESSCVRQERVKGAIRQISEVYHPYDLQTGAARSTEEVSSSLEKAFSEIETVAGEANLPDRCLKKIKKAKRVVVDMVATISFFFLMIRGKIEALGLSPHVEQAVFNHLIPGIYLHLAAQKSESAEQKHRLRKLSQDLLTPLHSEDGPFRDLKQEELDLVEQVAVECAQLFQRSSSCVEGRNGQLALRHHSLHRLSNRKLEALTTVHNYFIKREDGTTAAERFFGAKPKDLFQWVLERVDLPGRSAQKRSRPKCKKYLSTAAA